MPTATLDDLRRELLATHHVGRISRMLALGRAAQAGGDAGRAALELIDTLSVGDVYERRLVLYALQVVGDGERLLPFTEDEAESLRSLAFTIVPRICDDDQALRALRVAYALRRDRDLLQALARQRRRTVVDRYLDWLAEQPGLHDFADLVPLATAEGIHRHLERALSRPSMTFWRRLARFAPAALAEILCERLRAVPDEPDPPTRQRIDAYIGAIIDKAPEAGLVLLELLLRRGIHSHINTLLRAGALRPRLTLGLIERLDLRPGNAPFHRSCDRLDEDELERIAARDPDLLGDARKLDKKLSTAQLRAVVRGWLTRLKDRPTWGFPLLEHIDDPQELERAYQRWTVAARDARGVIPLATITKLPAVMREREARRHLDDIVALRTTPNVRIPYARFLPWDEAKRALYDHLGFPDGAVRGLALSALLSIPGLRPDEPELVERALKIVTAKKNEQDPVRMMMIQALVAWPRRIWRAEHATIVSRIVRDALDAGDLSHGTAVAAETLVIRTFGIDPASAARSLATLLKERGTIYNARLGEHLEDDEVSEAAPHLLTIAKKWAKEERVHQIAQLAASLGERIERVPGLAELIGELTIKTPWGGNSQLMLELLLRFDDERYRSLLPAVVERWTKRGWNQQIISHCALERVKGRRQPPPLPVLALALEAIARGEGSDTEILQALTILRSRAPRHFDGILGDLLERDPSYVCVPVVYWYLHSSRQDLLGPFLELKRIRGRFATGKTAWLLPFSRGFYRWTPAQNGAFAASHAKLMNDQERDTPTVWRSLSVYAALDSAPMEALAKMADDPRPAIQERALRVMARCDRGQCVPTLLRCLHDERARIAIYGLRRAIKNILPARAAELLDDVPMRRVTVAKEVLRLLGELRSEGAYRRLIRFDGTQLHRDVRIALLRALWDHLDRETTWEVFDRAVSGDDWVMASRLADIPADRLTKTSDRRLSALLGRVLDRPEPEARIDLLRRAAQLGVRDPDRDFLEACARRLSSPYDDEVRASLRALLVRGTEDDMRAFPGLLQNALADPRALHVAITSMVSFPLKTRGVWTGAAKAAAQVLAEDPRWTSLRIRCEAAIADPDRLVTRLLELAEAGLLVGDALEEARRAVQGVDVDALESVVQTLMASPLSTARWLSVGALVRDAGPERGWSPERLARLAVLQADPAAEVSGAALAVSPPREMVEVTDRDDGGE